MKRSLRRSKARPKNEVRNEPGTGSHLRSTLLAWLIALTVLGALLYGQATSAQAVGSTVFRAGETASASSTATSPDLSSGSLQRTLAEGTRFATPYYDHDSGRSGPTVVVVGGMHGDEPAGYMAARRLAGIRPVRGRLIVIPEANRLGVQAGTRNGSHPGDLNRDFPRSKSDTADSVLAESIWALMTSVRPDYLFDLHEGYDFHKVNASSVGQSLIYYPTGDAASLAQAMQAAVNAGISQPKHRFSLLRYPVKGSLARAAGIVLGTKAMILETSRKQSLEDRIAQHVTMVRAALERLGML